MANSPSRYEQMTTAELQKVIKLHPIAYLPAGIVEWHGEQSACGLDALKAETLCQMAADAIGGVCFPTTWLGPDASTPFDPTKYPRGTVTIDKKLYCVSAEELLTRIEALGFKVAVYLSGHYPGVIPEVAEKFNQRGGMKVISISENNVVKGLPAGDHAAAWETSLLMVLRPGLVDLSRLPPLPPTTRPAGDVIPPPWPFHQTSDVYGIYGFDPRIWANAYFGRRGTEAVIQGMAGRIGEVLGRTMNCQPIVWPSDDRQQPETRYDHLLPSQWMQRFEQAPVVYLPLAGADDSIKAATNRAIEWARTQGGMVFPSIGYAPETAGQRVAMNADTYTSVISDIAAHLADMRFRVIVLVTSPRLAPQVREQLAAIRLPGNQSRIVLADASAVQSTVLDDAIAAMIPRQPAVQALDGSWRINERQVLSLGEARYGLGDTRVYEHEFNCTAEQAAGPALLDLGIVENRCEVSVNDQPVMVHHWPPYRFVVTGMLRPGINRLKVAVRHQPQPTLDYWFYRAAPPRLVGPVKLLCWKGPD